MIFLDFYGHRPDLYIIIRSERPMKLYGALEAGGTKMVCAIGDENGNILM